MENEGSFKERKKYIKELFEVILNDNIQNQVMNLIIDGIENEKILEILLKQ